VYSIVIKKIAELAEDLKGKTTPIIRLPAFWAYYAIYRLFVLEGQFEKRYIFC